MRDYKYFQRVLLLLQIGSSVALPIVGGIYVGAYIDNKLSTNSIFLILGFLLGALSGIFSTYRLISFELLKKRNNNKD